MTCLKPVDEPQQAGLLVRLWETAGRSGPVRLVLPQARRAVPTDLLERPQGVSQQVNGGIDLTPRPYGFMAVRWEQ